MAIFPIPPACTASATSATKNRKLVQVTKECVELGLAQVKPWGFLGDGGQAVNDHTRANGYRVVREIGGHGCGLEFHEDPWVSYVTKRGTEMALAPGMIFTIEPMVNMGTDEVGTHPGNTWEIFTADGKPSAQWENHGAGDGYGSRSAVLVSGFTAFSENPCITQTMQGFSYACNNRASSSAVSSISCAVL